ncbi:MAG: hypothetical protein R3C58_14395 [Parvularculaceae bacterium]
MKWLVSLCGVQTVLLGAVALKAFALDAQIHDLAEASENIRIAVNAQAGKQTALPVAAFAKSADITSLSAADVRAIIREELSASGRTAQAQPAAAPIDRKKIQAAQADIENDLSRYRARGSMTPAEVDLLTAKIADLPPAESRAALIAMTKAVNSGEIAAQF